MFRCENCGSAYSVRAASSWEACPRCLARERVAMPLTFELGWRGGAQGERPAMRRVSLERGASPVEAVAAEKDAAA